jgi:hypothetical protein
MKDFIENSEQYNKVHNRIPKTDQNTEDTEVLVEKPKEKVITVSPYSLKNIVTYLLILFSAFLYILSLEGCQWDTQTACLVNLSPEFFYKIAIYLITSAFIVSFVILLIFLGYLNKKHFIYIAIIFGYLAHFHDTGANLTNHGSYNKSAFYVFIIVDLIILSILRLLLKLVQMKYTKLFFMILVITFTISIFLSYKLRKGCERWTYGLKDKVISDHGSCRIKEPQSCWVELLDGLMDVSWLLQEDCQNFRYGERAELMKYIPNRYHDSYKLAYPITTNFTFIPESYHMPFFWNLMNTFIDLHNPKNNNVTNSYYTQKPEVTLEFDRTTKLGAIHIDVNRNEEIVKERTALRENNPIKIENVLYIYIDSISRQHFLRKMKKTRAFIEKHMGNQKSELKSYQFMKYHTFIYFTQPNINPMFYGESMYHNNGTHIIKHFKDKGYITGHSVNICSRELYDIEQEYIDNLTWEAFDHENVALFCDPNFFNPENPFTPYMGPYSVRKRCLYGKDTFEYVLEYGEKFWGTYLDQRKFLRVAFEDAHEGTGEVARYLDDRLITFLNTFEKNGWLKDTAIIFTSDHGNNMIGFYNIFNCEDFFLEKTLGTFFMLLPNEDRFNTTNLLHNEEVLVTPYDVYNTMMDLINMDRSSKYISRFGESVLDKIDSEKARNCENYRLDLKDLWCRCTNN